VRFNRLSWFAAVLAVALPVWQMANVKAQVATAEAEPTEQQAESVSADASEVNPEVLKRVTYDIQYLSSDEMGGRQPGTPGIKLAEEYIVQEYKKAGLKPLENGTYFQKLEVAERGPKKLDEDKTSLTLNGPDGKSISLELGKQYQQLSGRRSFDLDAELVFVGYGISAEEHNYDEFADVDIEGKIVVLIRMEPQQNKEDSVFDGTETTRYASGSMKAVAAARKGAKAILMVNDAVTAPSEERDELIASDRFGTTWLPFAQIKRSTLNELLAVSPLTAPNGDKLGSVSEVEALIDENLEPVSQPIKGWSADIEAEFVDRQIETYNIVGVVEGEGPHADETIVIGGHYDHLGMGAYGSRAGGRKEIHNGADDNATGTAAVIELGRRFANADKKPGRRLVFIAFTAEEMGLLGAKHYVDNPIYPLDKTIAMVNFDMIGWLRENRLTLYNWDTSPQFDAVFETANEGLGFDLNKPTNRFGGSDHLPFNAKQIPNMFIHTGTNAVYHTPEDDFEAIDCEGAVKVIDYSENVVRQLADMSEAPEYGRAEPRRTRRFRLGVLVDDQDEQVTIEGITPESTAEAAGLQKGDVIIAIGDDEIKSRRHVTRAILKYTGKTVKFKIKRDDTEMSLNVPLNDPKKAEKNDEDDE
jgi:hypothetical protein